MEQKILTRQDISDVISLIQDIYLQDTAPWICGYSGGKDSTAVVQLVWYALRELPKEKRHKPVHIISTDTLVESPVVAAWANSSLNKMKVQAEKDELPIIPHRLTPQIHNTYWVNLIGKGYPFPRRDFRWCTDRLKIDPSNQFIKNMIAAEKEAILVLGSRKAESSARKAVMEGYEKKRQRAHLSPNGSFPNSYIFTPIEDWLNDNVWQYLMQYENPWGHSNKDLLAMYSGASADGECPLVIDTGTPSCGNSRFGCWICTLVTEDKSMAAMIQNDEEKSWMLPLLDFRNDIASNYDLNKDRDRRDFRRMTGGLTYHRGRLVHGPYTKATREYFLSELLKVEKFIQDEGPDYVKDISLITLDELKYIRKIWLEEKHEFDDSLPRIYEEITGKPFEDDSVQLNKFYSKDDWDTLSQVCKEEFPEEELLLELQASLLDIEASTSILTQRKNIMKTLESTIKQSFFKNEEDALKYKINHDRIVDEEYSIEYTDMIDDL